jgi:selenocysteine lyase/cysteine desulfurase
LLEPSEYQRGRAAGYLDTAAYGLPPDSAVAAIQRAVDGWRRGAPWAQWEEDGEACRSLFAGLVGASAEQIALLHALSPAAGLVAASLPARAGDNIVLYERDFTSTVQPWRGLEQRGVELRLRPLADLAQAVDERTALVAFSLVQSADGRLADLPALQETGARLFVDVTQAVGAMPVEVGKIDYLAAHPYKWLCSPRGLAFLYVRPDRLQEIEPWWSGWKSREQPYDDFYGLPELTGEARRLDVSLAWLAAAGARPSLELIASLGIERIAEHDLGLARLFCAEARLPEPQAPIVRLEVTDSEAVLSRLASAGVRAAGRAGAVRLSFHLYNEERDVARALDALPVLDLEA